jgi:hypothetical protein
MPAYLVRLVKNKGIVGIFTADGETDLRIVDECTDVTGCEYMELPPGGIMWESPATPVPLGAGDPEDDESAVQPFPWANASLTERRSRLDSLRRRRSRRASAGARTQAAGAWAGGASAKAQQIGEIAVIAGARQSNQR